MPPSQRGDHREERRGRPYWRLCGCHSRPLFIVGWGLRGFGERFVSAYLSVAWASCIYCLKWAVFPINVKSTVRGWEGLSEGKGMNLISEPPFCKPSVLYGNGKTGHRSALKDNFALGEGGGAKCYFCYFLISWIVESGI